MFQYNGLQVTVPLNGSRECKFTCPIYDINALHQSNVQHFTPLRRFVKVIYRGHVIFWGPIVKPVFNLAENSVEVNAHDPTIWLKHHYIHPEDNIVTSAGGIWDVDGNLLVELLETAKNNAAEDAAGYANLPMDWDNIDFDTAVRTIRPRPGQNVWDVWMDVVEAIDGPDFRIIPVDDDALWAPAVALLNTYPGGGAGSDKTDTVHFHFGFGRTNLSNFIHEPDGNNLINRFTAQSSKGVTYRVAKYNDGIELDGIMESWEQASEGVNADGLEEWAKGHVKAYGKVPLTFTIQPTWDMGLMGSAASTPWRFPSGFQEGDEIRAIGRLGNFELNVTGRITKVTLSQLNEAENVASQIELIPDLVEVADISVGPDATP
jgi:hypothetical protein